MVKVSEFKTLYHTVRFSFDIISFRNSFHGQKCLNELGKCVECGMNAFTSLKIVVFCYTPQITKYVLETWFKKYIHYFLIKQLWT